MKIWLFDILACPMDKSFPLKLMIFSYENNPADFKKYLDIYRNRDLKKIKEENIIQITHKHNEVYLKDNIIIEDNSVNKYFSLILLSINEIINIVDMSSNDLARSSLEIILKEIKSKITDFSLKYNIDVIEDILPELYFLNKIKIEIEIESGLLFCEKCKRWYPIIETIPQMLPDEYRDKEKDLDFLKNNKNLLDEDFLNQDLKPFNL